MDQAPTQPAVSREVGLIFDSQRQLPSSRGLAALSTHVSHAQPFPGLKLDLEEGWVRVRMVRGGKNVKNTKA